MVGVCGLELGALEGAGWAFGVSGSLVLPANASATMVRDDEASLLDYGVASRGLFGLLRRCTVATGAPWAPRLPLEFRSGLLVREQTCTVLARAPA